MQVYEDSYEMLRTKGELVFSDGKFAMSAEKQNVDFGDRSEVPSPIYP